MTLVNYAYHTSVTDSKDFLSKLRTFAVAQGWTGSDYQTSVTWDTTSPYTGWISGNGDFLQLVSTCYGSCDKAVYRFYAYNVDADHDQLVNTAHTTNVYLTNTSVWPTSTAQSASAVQDRWGATQDMYGTSMPSSAQGIDKVWFFGNQYYVYAIAQFDDYLIATWHIGTIDLYSEYQSRTDCAFCGWSNWQNDNAADENYYAWDSHDEERWFPGLLCDAWSDRRSYYFDVVYFSSIGQNRQTEKAAYSYYLTWGEGVDRPGTESGAWNRCKNVARTTGYNAKRIGFKIDFVAKDTGAGLMRALGKTPFYVIPFYGLGVGESITTDGKTYLCFPFGFSYMKMGYAFRIA